MGSELLPHKFEIDKRIVYLSAQVRSGTLTKERAKELFDIKPVFDWNKCGEKAPYMQAAYLSEIQPRENFKRYNFKKYKLLIWLLAKLKVVPYTFYKKYCN